MKKIVFAFAIVVAGGVVLATFTNPLLLVSPGRTIDAHEEFAADCFACHTPLLGSRAGKCIECHKVDEIGLRTSRGVPIEHEKTKLVFHQKLVDADCVACHSDHRGVQPFRPIGRFSHELLEPALRDDCRACHGRPGDALHRRIEANCGDCHGQDGWLPATFDHAKYFRFDRHHRTACTTCHVDADYSAFTCYGCHEHSRAKIRREHLEEGIRDYENCAECHRSGDEDEAERLWKSKRRDGGERGERDD